MTKPKATFAGIYGAILIGSMVNLALGGVGFLLVLQYFKRHGRQDSLLIRATIATISILAILQSVFSSYQVYDLFVTKQGDAKKLNDIIFAVPAYWICGYLTSFTAELLFCQRIWTMSRRMHSKAGYFIIPAVVFALLQIGAGLALVIVMATSGTYSKMSQRTPFLMETTAVQGVSAALSDITISATLCYIFHSHRSQIQRTNSIINKLITYAINRAMATGICTLLTVLLFCFYDRTYYFIIFLFASTHLYVISAVSMLTSGEYLHEDADSTFHVSNLATVTSTLAPEPQTHDRDSASCEK
ncbi:hypothetical protein CPB83DRAFT_853375 [Crepidotus variabilis]|uniref:DUF6534 domain-containing protein n=1 Tax=Crepidotus variabilis TaxID=179855 RepID=A0A9P6JQ66_9AGAR|nr:hypothetical protein CPB83DRAFT_853375 [Crepidotus variabilis]